MSLLSNLESPSAPTLWVTRPMKTEYLPQMELLMAVLRVKNLLRCWPCGAHVRTSPEASDPSFTGCSPARFRASDTPLLSSFPMAWLNRCKLLLVLQFFDSPPAQIALFHLDLIPQALVCYWKKKMSPLIMFIECCCGLNHVPLKSLVFKY